jgi:hypothetical protein
MLTGLLIAMDNPSPPIISAIVAIMSVGSTVAVFPAPYVADHLGRYAFLHLLLSTRESS